MMGKGKALAVSVGLAMVCMSIADASGRVAYEAVAVVVALGLNGLV